MKRELWRALGKFPDYSVSNRGNVKRITQASHSSLGRTLKSRFDADGYVVVGLYYLGKQSMLRVHCLVAGAFVGERPKGFVINHIDCNRANNQVENLEYVSYSENLKHAIRTNKFRVRRGEDCKQAKLSNSSIKKIRELASCGLSQRKLASKFEVTQSLISKIVRKEYWRHI